MMTVGSRLYTGVSGPTLSSRDRFRQLLINEKFGGDEAAYLEAKARLPISEFGKLPYNEQAEVLSHLLQSNEAEDIESEDDEDAFFAPAPPSFMFRDAEQAKARRAAMNRDAERRQALYRLQDRARSGAVDA